MQKSKAKVILISQFPLPYSQIASWPTMYNYLLEKDTNQIDYIISPKAEEKSKNISYQVLRGISFFDKLKGKFLNRNHRYSSYTEALDKVINKNEKYIIHIIDNSGIVIPINAYLKGKHKRADFFIQYCFHGYLPIVSKDISQSFFNGIDEVVFLTKLAYSEFKNFYNECNFKARVINNGVNTELFKTISNEEKLALRKEFNFSADEVIFMWCSQDRPKKGLHIVLEAFERVYKQEKNIKLIIVGVDREIDREGVKVIGRVQNSELPKYYQLSDVYLFSSLCKEGFGIVLAEALNCDCYCIASNQGGIPEVLNFGEYGVIIENPNFVDDWVHEMKKSIHILGTKGANPFSNKIPKNIYDIEDWCDNVNIAMQDAKESLN